MSTAYVFPGQGSQVPGMGRAFYEGWAASRQRFDALDAAVDADLHGLCFDGDEGTLRETANAQPAVFAAGIAAYAGVHERIGPPDYVAGHSLGHLTAATAAGALGGEAGVELVRRRGQVMQRAADADGPGRMLAVLLAAPETVVEACERSPNVGVAGFNAPRQTVISGTRAAVERVRADLDARTRARFRDLDVGAAFHSPVMATAVEPFENLLEGAPFRPATVPICSDVTGAVYADPAVARRDLAAQVTSPIDWVGVVEALDERGVTRYVEFPPAGTLSGLIDQTAPDADTVTLETPADVAEVDR